MAAIRYDGASIALHWVTALLVVTLFGLAEVWGFLPRGTLRHGMQWLHISLGVTLAAVILVRLLWRGSFGRRLPDATSGLAEIAARGVHGLLYLLLLTMIATGFTRLWSQGHAPSFFGIFSVPAPIAIAKSWHRPVSAIHTVVAWSIICLAGLHAVAALFHHYALRDSVLRRMLPERQST